MAKDKTVAGLTTRSAKIRCKKVAVELGNLYPEAECELNFQTPLELLVATILSAQCTDRKVNEVTPALFEKYPTAAAYAGAEVAVVEECIRSLGLFRAKAKNIVASGKMLVGDFNGKVPRTIEELVRLPGVGRKTANCVLVNAFDLPGITCDTHVIRVTNRLGLYAETNANKIEILLKEMLPEEMWADFSHRVIWHGRRICTARKPACDQCTLRRWCEYGGKQGASRTGIIAARVFPLTDD